MPDEALETTKKRGGLRRLVPAALRRLAGRAVSRAVELNRDAVHVKATLRNVVPVALTRGLLPRRARPSVCAVFAGRNDDYVPDNEARIRAAVEWNTRVMCDEVVFVEWNPVPGRPLLSTALARDYPHLRAYVVPPELHAEVCEHPRMVMMEEFGKNVGLRRARSEYVCVTNAYIFWDMNVRRMRRLMDERLVFRTRRVELRWDGRPVTQDYLRDPRHRAEFRRGWRQELAYGCGDFTLAHRGLWHAARGYDESLRATRIHADGRGLLQLLKLGGRPAHMGLHYHIFHESSSTRRTEFTKESTYGASFPYWADLPYENGDDWGLGGCVEVPVAERVWRLALR